MCRWEGPTPRTLNRNLPLGNQEGLWACCSSACVSVGLNNRYDGHWAAMTKSCCCFGTYTHVCASLKMTHLHSDVDKTVRFFLFWLSLVFYAGSFSSLKLSWMKLFATYFPTVVTIVTDISRAHIWNYSISKYNIFCSIDVLQPRKHLRSGELCIPNIHPFTFFHLSTSGSWPCCTLSQGESWATQTDAHINFHGRCGIISRPNVQVVGLWEEAGVSGQKPCGHGGKVKSQPEVLLL